MKRALAGIVIALSLGASGAAQAQAQAQAQTQAQTQTQTQTNGPEHHGWFWSLIDASFGTSVGGITYGNAHDRVVGSDKLVHQVRAISGVHGIEVRGPIDVVLKQAPVEKLTLHTDDNLTALIETPVTDGILVIGVKDGASFRTRHPIGVTVEVPRLRSIKLLASGDLTCADFESDILEITIQGSGDARFDALRAGTVAVLVQGSGDVRLSGTAPKQGYVIEGSGDLDAGELAGRDVAVRVNGSGDANVWATDALSVDINGSGDVHYRGKPSVRKSINGSGELITQ